MWRYIGSRLVSGLGVLLIVSLLAFGLEAMAPGDPASLTLQAQGLDPITPADIARQRAIMRLDDPLPVRYLNWLTHAVQGDLGNSFRSNEPVTEMFASRFPATLALAVVAALLSIGVAVPLGILAAYRRGKPTDTLIQVLVVLGAAAPGFWIALVLILIFAATLKWLPAFGTLTPQGIIMPAIVLALPNISLLTRLTRATFLDAENMEFVRVARAKGLSGFLVTVRHILPNALIPILTVFSLEIAYLMTGSAVIENIFAWPGIGRMAVDAALYSDIPVLVAFIVGAALVFVLVNLLTDILILALDPRLRQTGSRKS
jgi:peptide/nickel transport system permease protein